MPKGENLLATHGTGAEASFAMPIPDGRRVSQMANVAGLLLLIPAGLLPAEYAQRKMLAARTWFGRGVVCEMLGTICLAGQCLLDWNACVRKG